MSKQQRNQNTSRASHQQNKRSDDSDRSTFPAHLQPKRPSKELSNPTDPNIQPSSLKKRPPAVNEQPPVAQQPHTGQAEMINRINAETESPFASAVLINLMSAGYYRTNSLVEGIFRNENRVLQSKIKESKAELKKLPRIWNFFQDAYHNADDRMRLCCDIQEILHGEYAEMLNNISVELSNVEPLNDEVNGEVEEGHRQEEINDRHRAVDEQRLDKISSKIDFITKTRDNLCSEIAEMNKIESQVVQTIEDFRQSNQQMKQDFRTVELKFENEDDTAASVTENASKWMNEKRDAVSTLDYVKCLLKKDKKKISIVLKKEQAANKALCDEIDSLIKEGTELEDNAAAVDTSTKLRTAAAQNEFERNRLLLSEELEKMTNDTKLQQLQTDTIQADYKLINRINAGIATFREKNKALEKKIEHLRTEEWKQSHKISVMEEYINETNSRRNQKSSNGSVASKRRRLLSSNTMNEDMRSFHHASGASYDLKDIGSEFKSRKSTA